LRKIIGTIGATLAIVAFMASSAGSAMADREAPRIMLDPSADDTLIRNADVLGSIRRSRPGVQRREESIAVPPRGTLIRSPAVARSHQPGGPSPVPRYSHTAIKAMPLPSSLDTRRDERLAYGRVEVVRTVCVSTPEPDDGDMDL
jgi:hypothetical protein